jgi:hypothetical protein
MELGAPYQNTLITILVEPGTHYIKKENLLYYNP